MPGTFLYPIHCFFEMKNIAIFTSGTGEKTMRLSSLFSEGNRIRIAFVLTDNEELVSSGALSGYDLDVRFIPRQELTMKSGEICSWLKNENVELVAMDDFDADLSCFSSNEVVSISLSSPENAPREVVAALNNPNKPDASFAAEETAEKPKTPDEEWAEALNIKFDNSRLPQRIESGDTDIAPTGCGNNRPEEISVPPMPSSYMTLAVLMAVLFSTIPGIVAIIFSSQVTSKYSDGDYSGSERASVNAQIWIIVSFVLGVLSATLYLPIMLI